MPASHPDAAWLHEIYLLLEGAYGPLEPNQRRVLEDVVESARDLKEMIRADRGALSFD